MDDLCPFFKVKCHGNGCVMWKNEECLVVSFLQSIQEVPEEGLSSTGEITETGGMILRREAEVPKWLKTSTPEELAVEIIDFAKKEFPEEEGFGYHSAIRYFWESKGVQEFLMPSEVHMKIERANYLAERQMVKEKEEKKKKRLAEEKAELPSLVGQCLDWARLNNLKRLTLADVDTFIMEKELDLLNETKRAIYAKANVKLKSGK
jgi:hypothetical protein